VNLRKSSRIENVNLIHLECLRWHIILRIAEFVDMVSGPKFLINKAHKVYGIGFSPFFMRAEELPNLLDPWTSK
jgi:hypothetical protein